MSEPEQQRRRTEDTPPRWALELSEQVRHLSARVEALSLATPQRTPPIVYPSVVTAQALSDLASDPRTPPQSAPYLLALAALFPLALDEAHIFLVQQAYDHGLQVRQAPPEAPHQTPQRSRSQNRFINVGGRQMYVTNRGQHYDTAQPPPRPCRACGAYHWSWQCPVQLARFPAATGPAQNSPMGGGPAVPPTSL